MKQWLIYLWCFVSPFISRAQDHREIDEAGMLIRAEKMLTDVIVRDIFSPPVASRIYVYANMTAYEVLVKQDSAYRSLYGEVKSFPRIPHPRQKIDFALASVYAFLLTGKELVFSENILQDSISNILAAYRTKRISKTVFESSLSYGRQAADSILKWVSKDGYRETRKLRRYNFKKEDGKWLPTPPGYMSAIEPYWSKIRTIAIDSAGEFKPPLPPLFGKEKTSPLYKQALEVYETGNKLTNEQQAIANFWDCNPFFLNTEGHLNFATKKISPGGHWMSIVGIVCKQQHAGIMESAAAYTLTAIALFDSFIACWEEKYRSNLIRPETYINAYIDEGWRPVLQTPPFPEYNSGHSVISSAAALVLTDLFGDHFEFDDVTEKEFGLPSRHFTSFKQAAAEAAISRMYGGIHYRAAIENGQVQGTLIGNMVLKKIKLKRA